MKIILGLLIIFLLPWFIANFQEPEANDRWGRVYLKWVVIFAGFIAISVFF
jgi:hypothetical protein